MLNKFWKAFLAIFALLILPSAFAVEMNYSNTNIQSNYPAIYVQVLKYEPFPVSPGQYFDLWLRIENKGDTDAKDVKFRLKPKYPFLLDASENAERLISTIGSHQSALVNYKVRVDDRAVQGDSILNYEYQTRTANPVENSIHIMIQTPDSILSVLSVKTEPSTIAPGEKSSILIDFRNSADSYLRFITVNFGLFVPVTAAGGTTTYVELPFTPVGESNEKAIYELGPGEEKTFNFTFMANPDAEPKPYKIPFQISYYDQTGANFSKAEIVGVVVGSAPELYTIIQSDSIYSKGATADLPIKFVNKGTGQVKFLNVKLEKSGYYKIISADTYYIGKIDSDDYDTATFKVNIQKIKDRKVIVPISYSYRDSNNNEYSGRENLTLDIYSAGELGKGGSSGVWIIIAIIIIGIIYWQYRKWSKKRKKKTS